ncbi:MAG: SPOR domain-containing protein, partial [Bacteroidaceae bacterium]|nr:SPOR domain-containing protein [Bacteroidaceae bacterium]
LTVMNGGTLKAFNVACGSFSSVDNANNLRNTLVSKGYSAQVAQNPETGMYRVIAASFDDRATAVQSRDQLRGTYPDAWLLYRTY